MQETFLRDVVRTLVKDEISKSPPKPLKDKEYTVLEAAGEIGRSESSVRRYIKSGVLGHVKYGGEVVILQSHIDAYRRGGNMKDDALSNN